MKESRGITCNSIYTLIECIEKASLNDIIMRDNMRSFALYEAIREINRHLIEGDVSAAYKACKVSYDKSFFDFEWLSAEYSHKDAQALELYVSLFSTASSQGRIKAVEEIVYNLKSPMSIGGREIEHLIAKPSFGVEENGKYSLVFAEWNMDKWNMRGRTARTNLTKRLDINVSQAVMCNSVDAYYCIEIKSLDADGNGIFNPVPTSNIGVIIRELLECSKKSCTMCRFSSVCQSKYFDSSYLERTSILENTKANYSLPVYDEKQMEAIQANGFVRVTAGPGSGKTSTIVGKVNHLVNDMGVNPENILLLSFTNKAVEEMVERVSCILNDANNASCDIMTINSLAHRIVSDNKELLGLKEVLIISNEEKQNLVLGLLQSHDSIKNINYGMTYGKNGVVNTVLDKIDRYISSYRSYGQTEQFMVEYGVGYDFIELAEEYYNILKVNHYVTFDEELSLAVQVLYEDSELCAAYKELWRYIIVDEFQDVSFPQYELIRLLAKNELFIVGDDDQAIYGFRGGSSKFMLEFPYEKDIVLGHNYRSTKEIVDYATYGIVNNQERISKEILTGKQGLEPFLFKTTAKNVAKYIDYIVSQLQDAGVSKQQIAVLAPTNQTLANLAPALKTGSILGRNKIINDPMFALLHSIISFYINKVIDDLNLYHIFNVLMHDEVKTLTVPYGSTLYEYIQNTATGLSTKDVLELSEILDYVDTGTTNAFGEVLVFIAEAIRCCETHYNSPKEFIKELFVSIGIECNTVMNSLFEIIDNNRVDNMAELYSCLHNMRLFDSSATYEVNNCSDAITLMTCHESKGKEYDAIILLDSENLLSGKKDVVSKRNLGYVAMTRARKYLFIFSCTDLNKNSFVKEITDVVGEGKFREFEEDLVCLS